MTLNKNALSRFIDQAKQQLQDDSRLLPSIRLLA